MHKKPDRARKPEAAAFIAENLRLEAVPGVPKIRLYTAHAGSGLWRLTGRGDGPPPYWAYRWAGGTVLARYLLDHPEAVRGRRVLDLGAGAGIVGIAAMLCGASAVTAAEIDPNGVAALALNAEANGVRLEAIGADLLDGPVPDADLVAVGDLFYEAVLAERVTGFLDRCRAAGIAVLVGDPGRAPLPRRRLRLLAEYRVADFGGGGDTASGVFAFEDAEAN